MITLEIPEQKTFHEDLLNLTDIAMCFPYQYPVRCPYPEHEVDLVIKLVPVEQTDSKYSSFKQLELNHQNL